MDNQPPEIIVIDFSTKGLIHQDSANRLIIFSEWEHIALSPEARDAVSRAIKEAVLPFVDSSTRVKANYVPYRKQNT